MLWSSSYAPLKCTTLQGGQGGGGQAGRGRRPALGQPWARERRGTPAKVRCSLPSASSALALPRTMCERGAQLPVNMPRHRAAVHASAGVPLWGNRRHDSCMLRKKCCSPSGSTLPPSKARYDTACRNRCTSKARCAPEGAAQACQDLNLPLYVVQVLRLLLGCRQQGRHGAPTASGCVSGNAAPVV